MRKQTKLVAVLSAAALLAIGASMTSFAASKGWTKEDGEWVYLDSDGERVTEEWKKSGSNYYWLDEDGVMATDQLIEDEDDHYYVDTNGVRVTNQWRSVENEDDDEVDGKEVDVLWYYLGSGGRAYKASNDNTYKIATINGKKYFFDSDGHMVSGWTVNGSDIYYLGDENEGWAVTGWQYLSIDDDFEEIVGTAPDGDYESDEWFNFQSSGKARHADDGAILRKYVGNAYYAFDENGVMVSDWSPATGSESGASYYDIDNGNQAKGWIYTYADIDEGGDEKWFYMVSSDDNSAFNAGGSASNGNSAIKWVNGDDVDSTKSKVAAKVIKGKTYLFDGKGQMLTGVYSWDEPVNRAGSSSLAAGIYYFNKAADLTHECGQMETGKTTISYDGENYDYYFAGTGAAYTNILKDSSLYDGYGVKVTADDGNSYSVINVDDDKFRGEAVEIKGAKYATGTIIVTTSGKMKKSGTVTIDGVKYHLDNYFVTEAYDKEDKKKENNLTELFEAVTKAE